MSHNPALAYRPDIDGLRAIAVLAVVFGHYGIGGLSGGFVGVDVFYVISGFLITGIIHREIDQGRFTFLGFYERRVRRIFPALFVMLAATLAVGSYILLPSDLVLLGKSTIATLLFSSNILFWRTSGYFDSGSDLNPLLHTWSLAVEEQFYIGLPVLLILIFRFARGWVKPILIVSAIVSFVACLWQQGLRPNATFYLSPFRAWELLLGSYLAVGNLPSITKAWLRELLAWQGAALLLAGIVFINAGPEFPGWQALAPVVGTGLLIYAGSSGHTKVGYLLTLRPMVFIGQISYSLYLWHWPILVYAKFLNRLEPLGAWGWLGIGLSLLFATASYFWVETPFRVNKTIFTRYKLFADAVVATLLLSTTGSYVWQGKGMPQRFPAEVVKLDAERNPFIPFVDCDAKGVVNGKANPGCILGDKTVVPNIIVWGDSHALSWAPAFDAIFKEKNISGVLAFNSACPPLKGVINLYDPDCYDQNNDVQKFIVRSNSITQVVLVASWTNYSNDPGYYSIENDRGVKGNKVVFGPALRKTVDALFNNSKKVWLIGPTPVAPPSLPLKLALTKILGTLWPVPMNAPAFQVASSEFYNAATTIENIQLTNPSVWLCNQLHCRYEVDGLPLYRDGEHLNVRGANYLRVNLASEYKKFATHESGRN